MNRVDRRFASMGSEGRVRLESELLSTAELEGHADRIQAGIDDAEVRLTRFDARSELSALNRDPRDAVPASPLLQEFVRAARWAGVHSGGLVDATLLGALEAQGYARSRTGLEPEPLQAALTRAPARRPARAHRDGAYLRVSVDPQGRVTRPPGVRLDPGGIAKGLCADLAASTLPPGVRYAIGCGGDLALGAPAALPWGVAVTGAHDGREIHRLRVLDGGVATSGIGARLWLGPDREPAHHVLDPETGRPAWTGMVAVTAVAGSALEAEVLAKQALLSGPRRARALLRRLGGVLQHDDGRVEVLVAAPVVRLRQRAA